MSKLDKLLLLLNLLHNRPYVTIEKIAAECGVGVRTAYRYINSLSSARFPVDYDRNVRGYYLVDRVSLISTLTADEAAIILFGVVMLEHSLLPEGLASARRVRTKLEEKLSSRAQEILAAGSNLLSMANTPEYLRDYLLMSLVNHARANGLNLTVQYQSDDKETNLVQIGKPTILFDREWMICGQRSDFDGVPVPFRKVVDVELK